MEEKRNAVFAFISDQDIFHTFEVEHGQGTHGLIAGLRSNPIIVEITGSEHIVTRPGWKYIDGEFIQEEQHVDLDDYEVE